MKWRNIFSLDIHNTIHFEGDADQETCAPMVRYLWHPLKDLWRFKYSIFLLALSIKIWIPHFCFQGSCKTNDDCVTPGFHICSENCTDRFSSHQKYLRITACYWFSFLQQNVLVFSITATFLFQSLVPHARFPKQHREPGSLFFIKAVNSLFN